MKKPSEMERLGLNLDQAIRILQRVEDNLATRRRQEVEHQAQIEREEDAREGLTDIHTQAERLWGKK